MTTRMLRVSRLIGVLCLVIPGLLTVAAQARAESPDIAAANNRILLQVTSTRVDYSEVGNGYLGSPTGLLDTETGTVMGIGLSVDRMRGARKIYWHAGFDNSSGNTHYTGSLLSGGAYGSYVGTSSASLANYEARVGRGFDFGDDVMLTPYVEGGSHRWDRGVSYGELYTHYYYGFGLMAQYTPRPRLVLSVEGLLGRTLRSHITVNGGPLLNGFSAALGNSGLFRVGAAADYALNSHVRGNIAIEYTGFSYGMSAPSSIGGNVVAWEPDSTTRYLVLKIGLATDF